MENVILTIHLILALLLIGVVLLQRSEGGGLGMGGGGGAISGRSAANALTKLTWVFAIAFIITSITLTIIAAKNSAGSSVVDQIGGEAPAPATAPVAPSLGTDLLPPSDPTAPLTPPRVEEPAAPAPAEPAPAPAAPAEGSAPAPAPAPAAGN
ncbi:preprotein translocase subunit SecG [Aliigemmobacter aestuarii]|uniref:Protein-export membrane protein SecG n=1 Tax=Aliigemmobacter aestuarii TaxID=1445661 RepID=A0A4S3MSZ6_9RHOB|nr:preprotein translocase subunit SecG [Gemmobacter aestuarii]THD84601.1 preprotein translocase subunit SecG [Gemmobacter aestuarii]